MKSGWQYPKLEEVSRLSGGGTPSKSNPLFWEGEIPWVSPKDMWVDEVVTSEDSISEEALRSSATNLIPTGSSLCVVRSGILARKFPIAITGRPVAINQDLKAIIPSKKLDGKYLYHFLKSKEPDILAQVTTGATVHRLSTDVLRNLIIPLPPIAEQRQIARILDEAIFGIAALRNNTERKLAILTELAQSVLHRAFAGELS